MATKKTTTAKTTGDTKDTKETKVKNTEPNTNTDTKIADLEAQLSKAMGMIETLTQLKNAPITKDDKLTSDDYVTVISQCPNKLSLSTDGFGAGTVYDFDTLGEIIDIPFGDLKGIVRNNKSFVQKGLFYIANEEAVKQLRLGTLYKKLISSDDILNLLNRDDKTIIEIYKLAPDSQKETIINIVEDAKMAGRNIDANVLLELGELCGKDLIQIEKTTD